MEFKNEFYCFKVRVSAASTWASSSSTNVTINGEPLPSTNDDSVAVTPFHIHRVAAAHSYRSLTPLNMDLSDGHATAAATKLFSHDESTDAEGDDAKQTTSNETSLEMIKLSLTSSSAASEDRVVQTEVTNDNASDVSTTIPSTLSDRTLGPELPSLPTDQCDDEPVSLSQIQLQDISVTES